MLYQSIIVPIDLSHPDYASEMFEKAKRLLAPGGSITIVHAVPDIPAYVVSEMPEGFIPVTLRKSKEALSKLAKDAGVDAEVEILTGHAPRAILAAAESKSADLIIVASHRPGLSDYLLGSTAARVVRHANCSVLVLR